MRTFADTKRSTTLAQNNFWVSVTVFLLGTWLGAGALLVLQPLTGLSPDLLMLTQFGPSVGVLGVVLVNRVLQRPTIVAASLRPTPLVLRRMGCAVGALVILLGLGAAALAVAGQPVHLHSPGPIGTTLWLLVPLQFLGACGEELGWRGFLQPHLETRWSMTVSALVVGTLWAAWHIEYFASGPVFFGAFWLSCLATSVIMAQLVQGTGGGALLIAATFHCLLNLGTSMVLDISGDDLPTMLALAGSATTVAIAMTAARNRVTR